MRARLNMMGRFGNMLHQYSYARALCEKNGWELCADEWPGEKVLDIPLATRGRGDMVIPTDYHQRQSSMIYTRSQVKEWLKPKRELWDAVPAGNKALCHRRLGDYVGLGFTVVSQQSYIDAAKEHGIERELEFVTEESPVTIPNLHPDLSFIVDFIRMMKAPVLLRSNSTFSWWAATLGDAQVFSPIIEGLPGGEQHCKFVAGNWPKTFDADFVDNLHLQP